VCLSSETKNFDRDVIHGVNRDFKVQIIFES
jgi:hypothetical protein